MAKLNHLTNCIDKTFLKPHFPLFRRGQFRLTSKLMEIGHFDEVKTKSEYEPGQFFIHKLFDYRGVIIFPWFPKVNTRTPNTRQQSIQNCYYQVLVDYRDWPIVQALTEPLTTPGSPNSNYRLQAIHGLDYVAHKDIIPYTSAIDQPISHELFRKLFSHQPKIGLNYELNETLKQWQSENNLWLKLSDIYRETTENIQITVIPFYLGSWRTKRTTLYWWKYYVRVENLSEWEAQLRGRFWKIFSISRGIEIVNGLGIVGQEPILSKMYPIFQYSSHVRLYSPQGHMWGTLHIDRADGASFECRIPLFMLRSTVS